MDKTKIIAHQISVVTLEGIHSLGAETKKDLRDKEHILAVKKSREEYQQGKIVDTKKFLQTLK